MRTLLFTNTLIKGALCLLALTAQAQEGLVPLPPPDPTWRAPEAESVPAAAPTLATPTIALILPSQETPFARAAQALRAGFDAAHKASGHSVLVETYEIDESAEALARALNTARDHRVSAIVGPLTRVQVNRLVETGRAGGMPQIPLVTLNYPEWGGGAPPTLLAFGLAIEHEARQVVGSVLEDLRLTTSMTTALSPRFLVIGGQGVLARRATHAFVEALREGGERSVVVTPTLDRIGLDALATQVAQGQFIGAFLATDATEAVIIRARLPKDMPLFATSLVNAGGAQTKITAYELDGVRFADMPWLLEPDHAAVMIYPRASEPWTGELQRLYALGIDAYRLTVAWMSGVTQFEIDGVTGDLRADRNRRAWVERTPTFGIFKDGTVHPWRKARNNDRAQLPVHNGLR